MSNSYRQVRAWTLGELRNPTERLMPVRPVRYCPRCGCKLNRYTPHSQTHCCTCDDILRATMPFSCEQCGRMITTDRSYCDAICQRRAETHQQRERVVNTDPCVWCGRGFERHRSHAIYCSAACRRRAWRARRRISDEASLATGLNHAIMSRAKVREHLGPGQPPTQRDIA